MTASRFAHGLTESGEAWSIAYSVQGQGPDIVLLHGGEIHAENTGRGFRLCVSLPLPASTQPF